MKPVISYEGDDGKLYDTEEGARDASISFHVGRRLERLWPRWNCLSSAYGMMGSTNTSGNEKRELVSENFDKICDHLGLEVDLVKMRDYEYPYRPVVPDIVIIEEPRWWQRLCRRGAQ